MRLITLDTETTGMSKRSTGPVCDGHRIIEIACVEIVDNMLTGRFFHSYIKPEVDIQPGALKVHGITQQFLEEKPRFVDIVHRLLDFIGDSTIIIHNASFDIAFLNQEFKSLPDPAILHGRIFRFIDTLQLTRSMFPGVSNSLDSLSIRFGLQRRRLYHGALLDATILAEICLFIL
jgi:DNA polymerase III subunit epsilon